MITEAQLKVQLIEAMRTSPNPAAVQLRKSVALLPEHEQERVFEAVVAFMASDVLLQTCAGTQPVF